MDNNFTRAMDFILGWEVGRDRTGQIHSHGGYSNHPRDPGGATKWGISKRAHPSLDIPNLTLEKALEIYHEDYWKKTGCQLLEMPLAACVMNTAVMSGPKKALGILENNGSWENYLYLYRIFLVNLNRPDFLKGWINRLNDLRKFCEIWVQDHAKPTAP